MRERHCSRPVEAHPEPVAHIEKKTFEHLSTTLLLSCLSVGKQSACISRLQLIATKKWHAKLTRSQFRVLLSYTVAGLELTAAT
jgi:hypothetical protein